MRDAGFSLVEVLVATALLAVTVAGLAELFAISVRNNAAAGYGTAAAVLAAQKIEQLRVDPDLASSPASTLQSDTEPYVDHVGPYTRRWSIEPLPASSAVLVQVLVTRRADRGAADQGAVARAPDEARVITAMRRSP